MEDIDKVKNEANEFYKSYTENLESKKQFYENFEKFKDPTPK